MGWVPFHGRKIIKDLIEKVRAIDKVKPYHYFEKDALKSENGFRLRRGVI